MDFEGIADGILAHVIEIDGLILDEVEGDSVCEDEALTAILPEMDWSGVEYIEGADDIDSIAAATELGEISEGPVGVRDGSCDVLGAVDAVGNREGFLVSEVLGHCVVNSEGLGNVEFVRVVDIDGVALCEADGDCAVGIDGLGVIVHNLDEKAVDDEGDKDTEVVVNIEGLGN